MFVLIYYSKFYGMFVSWVSTSFQGLWLMKGGMHMKKRVYVIKFLNRLCIIMLIIALIPLIIKLDICL